MSQQAAPAAVKKHGVNLGHLFWWFLFANGGMAAATLLPVHILLQGILGPLGVVPSVEEHYSNWLSALENPIVKLYLFVFISLPFFHAAHRLRYFVAELGVHGAKSFIGGAVFYGAAIIGTVAAAAILITVP